MRTDTAIAALMMLASASALAQQSPDPATGCYHGWHYESGAQKVCNRPRSKSYTPPPPPAPKTVTTIRPTDPYGRTLYNKPYYVIEGDTIFEKQPGGWYKKPVGKVENK